MIVNMMIVLELRLECLVSKQWQQQIRRFQPGQPEPGAGGCSWKKFIATVRVEVYTGISGYLGPHTLHIE